MLSHFLNNLLKVPVTVHYPREVKDIPFGRQNQKAVLADNWTLLPED